MAITEYKSPLVAGIEKTPASAPEGLSPAKMGIVGWTDKGPSNFPIQVASVEEFTTTFGPISLKGVVPLAIRGFFGTGGQRAWVSRVVPSDAVSASVGIDSLPGPTKWTFTANGEGVWGNDLKVRIRGNRNFLNRTTNEWDKFDVLILQPTDFDPTIDEADEVYEQVQFTDSSQFDYLTAVVNDPRKPSLLIKLTAGAGGTPSGLLSVTVPSEAIGTGGGTPLASRFTATLANIPILDSTLFITAVSNTFNSLPLTPTLGTINGTTTAFNFQVPITDLPVVEGSLKMFYQKLFVSNENITAALSGTIDGTNKTFTLPNGGIANPVHRENVNFKLKYAATAGASPQPLTTLSTIAMTLASATGFNVGDSVDNGAGATGTILSVAGLNITVQIIGGTWATPTGSINDSTTVNSTTYSAAVITPASAAYNLATVPLTSTPVHPGTLSIALNVVGVGLQTITDNGAGVLTGSGGSLPGGGTINYTTGAMTGTTAPLVAASTVVATYDMSNIITKSINNVVSVANTAVFNVGDTVTAPGPVTGTVLAINATLSTLTISIANLANQFPTSGTINDTTAATSSSLTGTSYLDDVAQGVQLIGSVDGTGVNTLNLVDSVTTPLLSGAVSFKTAIAPLAGTNMYLDYTVLGIANSNIAGVLSGDVTTNSSIDSDTGSIVVTFTSAPLNGSTVDVTFQQGQLVQDNGLGQLIGDVNPAGANTVDYSLGTVDVTFASPPPSGTPITARYVKLAEAIQFQLSGGSDGSAVSRNDISNPNLALLSPKQGIYALDSVEEPLNIVVPDFEGSAFVQADIAAWADSKQNRFCIFSCAPGTTVDEAIQYVLVTEAFDTRNCAMYYPNVNFVSDLTGHPVLMPSSPFVAGVYAKTAANKNVGKSPGGIIDGALDAPGTVGPDVVLSLSERDKLYQARINPLMTSAATGFVVWGVRTLSRDLRWRYVNARLLNNFLMHQIALQLQWTVFENNGPALWVKITTALNGFLGSLFRLGYFAGQTASQAYFVKCDARNNNQTTIDAGRVNIDVGFSPNKPAEFVVFTLQQPASTNTV